MSKHNYSKYSNNNYKKQHDVVEETPVVEEPVVAPAPEVEVEQPQVVAPVEGKVVDCAKLNVREKPAADAAVVRVIDVDTTVIIDVEKSTDEWFHVCTATGVEGYCMRKFVKADL